jgi:hypothetical protein
MQNDTQKVHFMTDINCLIFFFGNVIFWIFQYSLTCVCLLFFSFCVFICDLDGQDDDGGRVVGQRLVDTDLPVARVDAEGRRVVVAGLQQVDGS